LLVLLLSARLFAHEAEPISTEYAIPFDPGGGNQHIQYDYDREGSGGSVHDIPLLEIEFGVWRRWQVNLGFPVTRVKESSDEPAALAGGRLEIGTRYLLMGAEDKNYAISFQGTLEAPTGNRRLFGDAPSLSPGIYVDRYLGKHLLLHSNTNWTSTVGSANYPERAFEFRNAVVWYASKHWDPVLELLGSTNTDNGQTQFAVQPEMILHAHHHLDLKFGVPLGTTSATPHFGIRAQVCIHWGMDR